jgi:hypothetical protein
MGGRLVYYPARLNGEVITSPDDLLNLLESTEGCCLAWRGS